MVATAKRLARLNGPSDRATTRSRERVRSAANPPASIPNADSAKYAVSATPAEVRQYLS